MKESHNRIYVLHLPPCINDPVCRKSAEKLLSAEKRRRLELFTCKPEHDRTLFGDLLVRTVLAKHTGIAPDQLCFDKGQFGKPVLRSAPFCFNLSHSGDYAVCAVSDAECGADIEQPRPVRRDFAARFFHPDETAFLQTCPADSYPIFLCRLWTLKEAYLKGLGRELLAFFEKEALDHSSNHLRTKAFLTVGDFNRHAEDIYIRKGYVKVGELDGLFRRNITEKLYMKIVTAANTNQI